MKLDKTKYEDDKIDQQKEEEERLLIVMVNNYLYNEIFLLCPTLYRFAEEDANNPSLIMGSNYSPLPAVYRRL